jgi:hypothetical protein
VLDLVWGEMMTESRRLLVLVAIVALVYVITATFSDLMVTGVGADVGDYLVLARSLAMGRGLTYVNSPAMAVSTQFPFGFPALLMPAVAAFPRDVLVIRLFAVGITLAACLVCYVFVRSLARPWALPITALFALNVSTIYGASYPQSDLPFAIVLLLSLSMCHSYARHESVIDSRLAATAVLALAASFIRVAGIVLFPALLIQLLVQRRFAKAGALGGLLVAGYAPWELRNYAVSGQWLPPQYVNYYLADVRNAGGLGSVVIVIKRIAGNGAAYISRTLPDSIAGINATQVQKVLSRFGVEWIGAVIGLAISGLVAWGLVQMMRRREAVAESIFLLLYVPVLLTYSFVDPRFLWPLLPLLYVYFFNGIRDLAGAAPARRLVYLATTVILVTMVARGGVFIKNGLVEAMRHRDRASDWVAWIDQNTQADDIIAVAAPRLLYFRTGRQTTDYGRAPCALAALVPQDPVRAPSYLVTYPIEGNAQSTACVQSLVKQNAGFFREVYRSSVDQLSIYRIVR